MNTTERNDVKSDRHFCIQDEKWERNETATEVHEIRRRPDTRRPLGDG